jgi:predicted component of type VI protein secretion system
MAHSPVPPAPVAGPRPAERIAALVEIRSRNGQPWAFVFRGGVVRIGRGTDNEIVLPDDRVSRRHGQLTSRQGTLVYTDLGSSNGSQVNGAAVREIALGVGDVVRVGNSTLTIRPGG